MQTGGTGGTARVRLRESSANLGIDEWMPTRLPGSPETRIARVGRVRRVDCATAAALVTVLLAGCSGSGGRHSAAGGTTSTTQTARASVAGPSVLRASVGASLPAPVSRAVVVADGDQLV